MKHKLQFVDSQLDEIRENNLYRRLRFGTVKKSHITINGKRLLNLCSNDYLGISTSGAAIRQMQSSSRLVSGNDSSYHELERRLARHKSQQAALIYPTGYMANLGAISTVVQRGDLVLSDSLNHASIIEACSLSKGRITVYRHNDLDDLARKLRQKQKRKFIITEGVFSMDGDFAELEQITELAEKNGAITILDDAHGDFAVGRDGRGTASHCGVAKKIDLYVSSLSKGLGSFGGYVASQSNVVDLCINRSKTFIYTSALPSALVRHATKRLGTDREKQRKKLARNSRQFSKGLQGLGYEVSSRSHIIPIIVGDEKTAMSFGRELMRDKIFAQPIRYPTVPKDKARIRLSVTAWLSQSQINRALNAFERIGKKFKML